MEHKIIDDITGCIITHDQSVDAFSYEPLDRNPSLLDVKAAIAQMLNRPIESVWMMANEC